MKRRAFLDAEDQPPAKKAAVVRAPALTLAQSQAVRREVNKQMSRKADYKQTIQAHSTFDVSYSGWVQDILGNLTRGDSPLNQYNGSSIQVKSIRIRGTMARGDTSNVIRLVVFQWFDSGVPVPSGVLNDNASIAAPYGSRYWTNKKSLKILRDVTLYAEAGVSDQRPFDIYIPGTKIRPTWFPTATDTPAQRNGLMILAVSDSSTVTHPNLTYRIETVYTDNE